MTLTDERKAHFDAFGFLKLPHLFSPDEMSEIVAAAEEMWAADDVALKNEEVRVNYFVERQPRLAQLVIDDRIYPVIEQLVGPDFIWVGSEGNISNRNRVNWHSDRKYYREGEGHWMNFTQVKVMMYLEHLTRETGSFRVIPGSHRMPYHKALAQQEIDPSSEPFGVDGSDIPCTAIESTPGDVILFNHCIWHAAYGGGGNRRYVAAKFAARPFEDSQFVSLKRYTPRIFEPHEAFENHEDQRIRDMVRELRGYAEKVAE